MENNITELVFILDRSGSMAGLETDTIGGFNAMLEKQKKLEGKVYVTTVLFSNDRETLHDRLEIGDVKPMTEREYCVGGSTALLDALGSTIKHIAHIHKYARPEDVPQNTIFVITTDGMENASRRFSAEEVKSMIKKEEGKYGWEFMFLAANIDAVETAERYGIRRERSANYRPTSAGTSALYDSVCCAVERKRNGLDIGEEWKSELEKNT